MTRVLGLLLFFLLSSSVHAETPTVAVPPIEIEGSASDLLIYDPVVPPAGGAFEKISPSGNVIEEISEELPTPVTDYATPGSLSQFRGLGRTVEDTNVEALGVPLNLPQGGGFDFSTFPQFVWSSYEFRLGPGGTALDPRASMAVMSLHPWTDAVLGQKSDGQVQNARFTALGGRWIGQLSAGVHSGDVAVLAGGTFGLSHGPTGSLSLRLPSLGKLEWRAHLLATSLDAATPGPLSSFSPHARQTSSRMIPVLEGNAQWGDGNSARSSVFFDRNWIHYDNPDTPAYSSVSRTDQYGIENAASIGFMTFGLSGKRATLTGGSYAAPTEDALIVRAGPTFRWGSVTLDGFFGGDYVNATGWEPEASLGARDDLTTELGIYTRESYTWRFPTLNDRFAAFPPFSTANPGLQPEQVMTSIVGGEFRTASGVAGLQGVGQFRNQGQFFITNPTTQIGQTVNSGHSGELSLMPTLDLPAGAYFDLFQSARLSGSTIVNYNQAIPYDPSLTYLAEARWHGRGETPDWQAALGFRGVTSSPSDYAGGVSPGYGVWHVNASYRLSRQISLEGRMENLLGRTTQFVAGYPSPGRLFALGAVGTL